MRSGSTAIRPRREAHLDITDEGLCVPNVYIRDIVVDDKVLVEAKAIEKFSAANFAQLNSYLHFPNGPLKGCF
jgi:GxxExxY protein